MDLLFHVLLGVDEFVAETHRFITATHKKFNQLGDDVVGGKLRAAFLPIMLNSTYREERSLNLSFFVTGCSSRLHLG